MGCERSIETETKSRDSITDDYSYMQFGFTAIIPGIQLLSDEEKNKFRIDRVDSLTKLIFKTLLLLVYSMCSVCTFVSFLSFWHEINSGAIYGIIILLIPA